MAISVVSFSFSWSSTGGPGTQLSAECWLSLPHLVSNFSELQFTDFLYPPSYIIVQSPTQYLWDSMFDRHQAEITVMQFTGHSLPVHQFMSVPWDFNPVPHRQPGSPTPMEYELPRLWNGMSGRVEGQYTTDISKLFAPIYWLNSYDSAFKLPNTIATHNSLDSGITTNVAEHYPY